MSLEKLRGKFLTFEGVEGAGKTTQSKLLVDYLNSNGIEAVWTREPGGCEGAEKIRALIVNGKVDLWDGMTELLLMYAARRDHTEKKIKPLLAEGKTVISDRYFDSTVAYQGYGHGLPLEKVRAIQHIVLDDFKPDLTFILDIDIELGLGRANARGERNRFEDMNVQFHKRVRDGFLEIAKGDRKQYRLIDTQAMSIEDVQKKILDVLDGWILEL